MDNYLPTDAPLSFDRLPPEACACCKGAACAIDDLVKCLERCQQSMRLLPAEDGKAPSHDRVPAYQK